MCVKYLLIICLLAFIAEAQDKFFNVNDYGAIGDGKKDNTLEFLKAWSDACNWNGSATVLVPEGGTYMLKSVIFKGPCKGLTTTFEINGVLRAPIDPSLLCDGKWINFRYISQLSVTGNGILHGQGSSTRQFCNNKPSCQILFTTIVFDFITNGSVQNIISYDSKGGHFIVFACENMTFTNLNLTSPAQNRNTDGIKVSNTNGINITSVNISTGDDCVAMISGTKKVRITDTSCGPGHGISVGSIGKHDGEEDVDDIYVHNCTFTGSNNGIRIKTWAAPLTKTLYASNFVYEDIIMNKVQNPIVIDQHYCPQHECDPKATSQVQIRNVTYRNVQGSSDTDIAVNLNCSSAKPCQDITVEDITLSPSNEGRNFTNFCFSVNGVSRGKQIPPACV